MTDGTPTAPQADAFDRVATRIGDLDHPFYSEERDRDVWNEASAVGFQAMLWGMLISCTVAIWVAGAAARPYVLTGTLLLVGASLLVNVHAKRRGVDGGAAEVLAASRGRQTLYVVLVGALAAGLVSAGGRVSLVAELDAATLAGLVVGVVSVVAIFAVISRAVTVRSRRAAED